MSTKIPIETSARHIHVSQEDFRFLFGEDAQLHYTKELSQPGQYLCQERAQYKRKRLRVSLLLMLISQLKRNILYKITVIMRGCKWRLKLNT